VSPQPEQPLEGGTGLSRILLILGVHLLLLAPLLSLLLRLPQAQNLDEKRRLADPPVWHAWRVADWTTQAESWINDHFPQRARVILWNSLVHERYLQGADSNVIVGRDGWLYFAGDGTAEDLLGRAPLSRPELEQWARVLAGRQAWLAQRAIKYLFVVTPNKSTIYPEHLPMILQWGARKGRLDQLLAYLEVHTHVPVADLRPALVAAKDSRLVYWPWDSHWSGYGLLVGCDELLRAIGRLGVRAGADDSSEWLSVGTEDRLFDCVDLIGLRGRWPVRPVAVVHMIRPPDVREVDSPLSQLPDSANRPLGYRVIVSERGSGSGRVAMFCDSFFRDGGLPLDSRGNFPLMIQFRRFTDIWEYSDFDRISAVARVEHPDIVVDQVTERLLGHAPRDNPEWEKARLSVTTR